MSASANTFVDGVFVCMNGSPCIPACHVHAVAYAADGIEPFSTLFSVLLLKLVQGRNVCQLFVHPSGHGLVGPLGVPRGYLVCMGRSEGRPLVSKLCVVL